MLNRFINRLKSKFREVFVMLFKTRIGGVWHYLIFFEGRRGESKERVLEKWIKRNPKKQRIVWKIKEVGGIVNVILEYVYKKDLPFLS